ncbi:MULTISPECIES: biliverdin-producing heme oxygenase [unclassified Devosia]|jgi:heme oxygenase|uniref:biliverdin-producing heme oxygenase n=1 Tax=unclassified Devosia TaxID=196773 RepID=UPI00071595BB|nr:MULTISPECIES: biliverdin-producing heme oxygenase [unclassified Devosia]KQN69714.1 hypothetical protein ASE94_11455 [Devosia sp. Leaf64]KQT45830.1 hypothetical protein ASG47_12850 [Devosia sp. Leaf420]
MAIASLRSALKERTAALHHQLDQQVGEFTAQDDYADYVTRSYLFRAAIEPRLAGDGWQSPLLADVMAQDLADLGRSVPKTQTSETPRANRGERLGMLYVLEGSSVGARLLLRRAKAIGFSEDFGARHLGRQAGDIARWPQFLSVLEQTPAGEHEDVLRASEDAFRLALDAYTVAAP